MPALDSDVAFQILMI